MHHSRGNGKSSDEIFLSEGKKLFLYSFFCPLSGRVRNIREESINPAHCVCSFLQLYTTQHARISSTNKKCRFSTFKLPLTSSHFTLWHAKIFFHLFKQLVESRAVCAIVVGRFYFLLSFLVVPLSLCLFSTISRNKHFMPWKGTVAYRTDGSKKSYLLITPKISLPGLCFNFSFLSHTIYVLI